MRYSILAILALAFSALFGAMAGGYVQDSQAPFSIRISTLHPVVETAAQARIDVLLTNTSTRAIRFYIDKSGNALFSHYKAHVYDSTNKHCKMSLRAWGLSGRKPAADDKNDYTSYLNSEDYWSGGGGWIPMQPGDTKETEFKLSYAYILDRPDTYSVWVSLEDPESMAIVKSNTITVTITGPTK
jgi:hypothetical protein